jgi:putative transposase
MSQVCGLFGISRQAHYQKREREVEKQRQQEMILELVRQVRRKHPRMGTRKLLLKMQPIWANEGRSMGRDRLFDLLRASDLLVRRKKSYRRTTRAGLYRAPNRLPGLLIIRPNQVWVCDITYLELEGQRFAYLFLLMDLFSRFILGWQVSPSLGAEGAVASLEMALRLSPQLPPNLIHHSDHGVQYTAHRYLETLLAHHILPSMGAVGNCYDNIFAERLIGSLKNEYGLDRPFANFAQLSLTLQEVIQLYNTDRPHLSLNSATPLAVYSGTVIDVPALRIPSLA